MKLIARMVVYAWYPVLAYKLSFGMCDSLVEVVNYIANTYNFPSNYEENKLLDFIYNSEDKILRKLLKNLTLNVPYRFLSPFFQDKVKGSKNPMKTIEELSKEDESCVYAIFKDNSNERFIKINHGWDKYLKYNYRILKGWTYYKLVCFLQKRNPNVPGIALKLEAPKTRDLKARTEIWKRIIANKHIEDLYTGQVLNSVNFEKYGTLSMDHFIPWSFVLHDQMWNLAPTFKNINSKKSDNLLSYDNYIDGFCNLQYEAFCFVVDNKRKDEVEEYKDVLKIADAKSFRNNETFEGFSKRLKKEICPVYNIAANQGFHILDKLEV